MLAFYLSLVDSGGERTLVEFLYNNYRQAMFKTAFGILHNESDAEDAVHEAFLRIIKNIEKFKSYSCKENIVYVIMVVKGISLNMLKKNNKIEKLSDNIPDPGDLEEDIIQKIEYDDVKREIGHLSPTLKTAATLYFIEGLPVSDIAEMLDVAPASVYSSISRARKNIVNLLKTKREYQNES